MTAHNPQKIMKRDTFLGTGWLIVCPCGNASARRLDPSEAKEEMQRHPVGDAG